MIFGCSLLISYEDFLEVGSPDYSINRDVVFDSDETAKSAMQGVYNQLAESSFSSGYTSSVTMLASLSAHEIESILVNDQTYREFEINEINPQNTGNFYLWSSAYNIIYMVNGILAGIDGSENLSPSVVDQIKGEALFIRAFSYFYLINLYGDVPLILSTSYEDNATMERIATSSIYDQILSDLESSLSLVSLEYNGGERTHVNRSVVMAFLARVHLFLENWDEAETYSNEIITSGNYELLDELNNVFLANSNEAIWQISPLGRGAISTHTYEGAIFVFHPVIAAITPVQLRESFVQGFNEQDLRFEDWIGFQSGRDDYYSFKYKIRYSTEPVSEYSMVMRLAEQYLIRSEARIMQGNFMGGIADLNRIKERAGIPVIGSSISNLNREDLLMMVLEERKKELFTEWGHRWLDLKRKNLASLVLSESNEFWENTDILFPIPEEERQKNNMLTQNPGY